MLAARTLLMRVAICLAILWAGAGWADAASPTRQTMITAPQAQREVMTRLKRMGVRGELAREVEQAVWHAGNAGPIPRRSQSFVGTSFGGEWKQNGRTRRAVVTFKGDEVHVDVKFGNGGVRRIVSRPTPANVPMAYQGMRIETWSPRRGETAPTTRVVGSDGEIVDSFAQGLSVVNWSKLGR